MNERRASLRLPHSGDVACQVPPWRGDASWWPARVRDVCREGLGLIVGRPFGNGSVLEVEMQRPKGGYSAWLPVRVIHATKQDDGAWVVGCAFISKLSDEELRTLL